MLLPGSIHVRSLRPPVIVCEHLAGDNDEAVAGDVMLLHFPDIHYFTSGLNLVISYRFFLTRTQVKMAIMPTKFSFMDI